MTHRLSDSLSSALRARGSTGPKPEIATQIIFEGQDALDSIEGCRHLEEIEMKGLSHGLCMQCLGR